MLVIENALVSDDLIQNDFVCNLSKCKGICCVEGDLGAPLTDSELDVVKESYSKIKKYLTPDAIAAIEEQGEYVMDWEGDYSTTLVNDKECVYVIQDEKGCYKCAFEEAYNKGEIGFKKPISCHLYPIRLSQVGEYIALNYDRWDICADACTLGQELKVPVYKFLKEPIIRAFGEEWYEKLNNEIENNKKAL